MRIEDLREQMNGRAEERKNNIMEERRAKDSAAMAASRFTYPFRLVVLCDLDHTLSDAAWRDPLIERGWDEYNAAAEADQPVGEIRDLVNTLYFRGYRIIMLTARDEKWRGMTQRWLEDKTIRYSELVMRPSGNPTPAAVLKVDLARKYLPKVAFVLEDREDICAAFTNSGVTVLQTRVRRVSR